MLKKKQKKQKGTTDECWSLSASEGSVCKKGAERLQIPVLVCVWSLIHSGYRKWQEAEPGKSFWSLAFLGA